MTNKPEATSPTFGPRKDVEKIMGADTLPKKAAGLRRWEANGFPPPLKLGYKTLVWNLEEVRAFLQKRQAEAIKKAEAAKSRKGGK